MNIIELQQGSAEWHLHRSSHFNASDAPAMLGISPYKTRNQLLHEMYTGLAPEVDAATQQRFADGHRFEALARSVAERIVGQDLYPVVGSEGKLSASFDGITMDENVIFEHKTLNVKLRDAILNGNLADHYRAQMEQQLMVSGATQCLFMASTWDKNDVLVEEHHCIYYSDQAMRDSLIQGWAQFGRDLATCTPKDAADKPAATPAMQLPALFIQVEGSFNLTTNLAAFGEQLKMFVDRLEMKPKDDQQFADAEESVKTLEKAEALIKSQESGALAQMGSVDEMRRTAALYLDIARTARLALEKAIKAQKDNIRIEAITAVKVKHAEHLAGLEAEINPIKLIHTQPDWAGAIKGLRKLDTLHDALDSKLAQAKIEMDGIAKDIRTKRMWISGEWDEYEFLFRDLQTLIQKPMDDFKLAIETRISQHRAAEAAKQEAVRAKMQAEEEAKATAKAKAEQESVLVKAMAEAEERGRASAAERAKVEAEAARAKASEFMPTVPTMAEDRATMMEDQAEAARKRAQLAESAKLQGVKPAKPVRPSNKELIEFVAQNFGVSYGMACDWVIETAESLREAA